MIHDDKLHLATMTTCHLARRVDRNHAILEHARSDSLEVGNEQIYSQVLAFPVLFFPPNHAMPFMCDSVVAFWFKCSLATL